MPRSIRIAVCAFDITSIRICQVKNEAYGNRRSAHQLAGEVEEAVTALDPARGPLADDRPGPREAGNCGLPPGGVVRVDSARRGTGLDLGAEVDQWFEQARLRSVAVVVGAADLHQPGGEFGRRRLGRERAER